MSATPNLDVQDLLNRDAANGVPAAAIGSPLVFSLLALTQNWIGASGVTPELTLTLVGVALYSAAVWFWLRRTPPTARNAHPILYSLCAIMCAHHAVHLLVLGDPAHTVNPVLVALACAALFTSRGWLFVALATCVAGWLPRALLDGPFSEDWRYWTAILGTGIGLAWVAFEAKRLTFLRLETLRALAEQRKREAETALAHAEEATAERIQMQQTMHEAQRRESLGVLAGGIAHDFNNLLTIILGNVELARLDTNVAPRQDEQLLTIESAANQAAALASQMLVYAGRAAPQTTHINLGERIRSTGRLFESVVNSNTQLVIQSPVPTVPDGVVIEADTALLDQVIVNLIQNAIDACKPTGGRIDVSWGLCPKASADEPSMAFIEISDTGCGMDAVTLQQAFDPFFSTKSQGTGLGLAVVKGIAESHNGALEVASEPGAGTRIRFILPQGQMADVTATETGSTASPLPVINKPILIVDDQSEVRRIAGGFLTASGYQVVEAPDGHEALRIARGTPLGAALVDLTMPGMSGYELVLALREQFPDLPIMLMSGFDRDDALRRAPPGPPLPFLAKPFSQTQLQRALTQVIEQSNYASGNRAKNGALRDQK